MNKEEYTALWQAITEAELARAFREITRAVAACLQPSIPAAKPKLSRPSKKRS
jgi:hypothetical protein